MFVNHENTVANEQEMRHKVQLNLGQWVEVHFSLDIGRFYPKIVK